MTRRMIAVMLMLVAVTTTRAAAAENEFSTSLDTDNSVTPVLAAGEQGKQRPAILPTMYVTLAAIQTLDVYTTTAALRAGGHEANPLAVPFVGNSGRMIGLKLVSTVSTIYFVERIWKTNRISAVVVLAAINGGMATVSLHNMRQVRATARRR